MVYVGRLGRVHNTVKNAHENTERRTQLLLIHTAGVGTTDAVTVPCAALLPIAIVEQASSAFLSRLAVACSRQVGIQSIRSFQV